MVGNQSQHADALGLYYQDVSSTEPLSADEECGLARRIRTGDHDARNRLVGANLRFVVRIASEYRGYGADLEDLIGAGNLGLITAAERFDETRGCKFVTYAVWWIRQAIHHALSQDSRTVRLPSNRIRLLHSIHSLSQRLGQVQHADPDPETIAEALGVPADVVIDTLARARGIRSLDAESPGAEGEDLLQVLPDKSQAAPDARLEADSDREQVETVLKTLEQREAQVLRMHYGLGDGDPMTLQEIGRRFQLTKERVRQIKELALRKLRHPRRSERLIDLM